MNATLQKLADQVRSGETVTLTEPWLTQLGYFALFILLAAGGEAARRFGFWPGWIFLIVGGLGLIIWPLSLLVMGRPTMRLSPAGLELPVKNVSYAWPALARFFVGTGETGEQWVGFRLTDEEVEAQTAGVNLELGSNFGHKPDALAEFLNHLRDSQSGSLADPT